MKRFIIFLIIVFCLAWALQNYTSFKAFDYVKGYIKGIDFARIWSQMKEFKLPSLSAPKSSYPPADKQLNIFIRDSKFLPNKNAIILGARATWYNEDNKIHTVGGDNWGSGEIKPGKTFSKVFDAPGKYEYHCSLHPGEKGEIIVQ